MIELIANGLAVGAIYALAALGFVMVHNATSAVNFAHGHFVVLGGYMGVALWLTLGLHPLALLLAVPVGMAAVGVILQRVAYYPLRNQPFVSIFISTIAIGIILANLTLILFGPHPQRLPPVWGGTVQFAGMRLASQSLAILAIAALLVWFQQWLFARTSLGRQLRATAQNPEVARLMGVPVDRMIIITFALATAYAGIAGVLLAPIFFLLPAMGLAIMLKVYIAAVIGGFGSLSGAVIGGLGLGVLEVLIAGYITSTFRDAIIFGILLVILVFRPQGIFGEVAIEAAEKA